MTAPGLMRPRFRPDVGVALISIAIVLASCTSATASDLDDADKRDTAFVLVSTFENSSTDWRAQYGYIENIDDGRGYTGGLIGFTSGTGDMLELVRVYTDADPDNPLAEFDPALEAVNGTDSEAGLGEPFVEAWHAAAERPEFRAAQDAERDRVYFEPAVEQGRADGLGALGQFAYYDALVVHGPGDRRDAFGGIRAAAMEHVPTPADGGDEVAYLEAFFDARNVIMREEPAHADTSRVDMTQRAFLREGNLDLDRPLAWTVYDDRYHLD